MADNRSDKCNYPSRYSPKKWVTAAQFIIELVCEKQAKKLKKDLPVQFWHLEEWQKEFVSQTRATNRLLKKYDAKVIIEVIKKKGIWSLRPKWVEKVIQEQQIAFNKTKEIKEKELAEKPKESEERIIVDKGERKPLSKRSKLLMIDEVENG